MDAAAGSAKGLHCSNCGLTLVPNHVGACPQCGGPLAEVEDSAESDNISVKVTFQQFKCDRCEHKFVLDPTGSCPQCGAQEVAAGTDDANAAARKSRWQNRVKAIARIAKAADPQGLRFSTRGSRKDVPDYIKWLQLRFFDEAMKNFQEAKRLLAASDWPAADASGDAAFDRLAVLVGELTDFVKEAESTPPPVLLLATHRGMARAAAALTQSISLFCEVIVAPHIGSATSVRNQAQAALDEAAALAGAISSHMRLLDRVAGQPGWFAWADTFDPGRATAELVSHQPTTISEAAALVRTTFSTIPEIVRLPDELAFALAPAALTSVLWDPLRLQRRIRAILRIFSKASSTNPNWIGDPASVAESLLIGHRQLNEQVGLLGFLARSGGSRKAMLIGSISVYERFAEGPLRRFGSVVRQAIEVAERRQQTLDAAALAEDQLGPIVQSLEDAAPVLVREFSFLMRNASAHYEFEVTDAGVTVTEPMRKGKKRRENLTDDDFLEMLFDLNELLVALEAATVAFAASDDAPRLKAELTRIAAGAEEQYEILRAIAGLRGWVELSFAKRDQTLILEGRYLGDAKTDPFVELLSTVAGALGVFGDVDAVVVSLRGAGRSCDYSRDRMMGGPSNPLVAPALAGRATADVLRQTGSQPELEVEARFLLVGPIAVLTDAIANNAVSIPQVREFCKWAIPWLKSEAIGSGLAPERDLIVEHLRKLDEAMAISGLAAQKNNRGLARAATDAMQREALALLEVRRRLRTLYA